MGMAGSARVGLVGVGFVSGQIGFIGRSVERGICEFANSRIFREFFANFVFKVFSSRKGIFRNFDQVRKNCRV